MADQVLDPSKLIPAGQYQAGGSGDSVTMLPLYTTPDGKQVVRGMPDGGYMLGVGDKIAYFGQQGELVSLGTPTGGTLWSNTIGKHGLGSAAQDVMKDGRFMAALGIAAGGALASTYAAGAGSAAASGGASGAAGSYAPIQTGAGIGEAAGAGSYGALGTAGAGSNAAWQGATTAQLGSDAAAAGTGLLGNTPSNPNAPKTPVDPAKQGLLNQLTQQLGLSPDMTKLLGGLLSGGVNSYLGNQQQQDLNKATQAANQQLIGAGNQAAGMTKFTPFNVSNGLTGVKTGADGSVSTTMDPRLQGIQDQLLGLSKGFLGGVNSGTPDQLAQQAYANYNQWAKPAQENQFSGLQDRLARQGLLGLNVNTGSVQGGGQTSINPYYKDFAEGVASADLKNYQNSILFGQQVANNQLGLGTGAMQGANAIDTQARGLLDQSRALGDSKLRGDAMGANYIYGSAMEAARNTAQRQTGEANADAARDRAIWDSLWKNL